MPMYQRDQVQIHYEERGTGFPLLVIPGGGLNATIAGLSSHVFNPLEEFSEQYRCIALDSRNAIRWPVNRAFGGRSAVGKLR